MNKFEKFVERNQEVLLLIATVIGLMYKYI